MPETQILWEIQHRLTTVEHRLLRLEEDRSKPRRQGPDWKRLADTVWLRLMAFAILSTSGGLTVAEAVKVAFR